MTATLLRPVTEHLPRTEPTRVRSSLVSPAPAPPPTASTRQLSALVLGWLVAVVAGMALVVYGFGPYFHDREQRALLSQHRAEISQAAASSSGLPGTDVGAGAPEPGAPVAILEIGSLQLQEVVVEGVGSSQTRRGPGHVPGTAGLGQPGNSVVVGRRTAFGGPFRDLRTLELGEPIVVSSPQGQSVYEVTSIDKVRLERTPPHEDSPAAPAPLDPSAPVAEAAVPIDEVYGASEDDQLTLITSASPAPTANTTAVVVVATMQTEPFPPTAQGGRTARATGLEGEPGATASVLLATVLYGATIGLGILLYRRLSARTAYLLTIAPVVAATVVAAETLTRAFPAWM